MKIPPPKLILITKGLLIPAIVLVHTVSSAFWITTATGEELLLYEKTWSEIIEASGPTPCRFEGAFTACGNSGNMGAVCAIMRA